MWDKTVYVTNDGTEFEREEQAFEYEIKDALVILSNPEHFIAYNKHGRIMKTEDSKKLGQTLENVWFMDVKTIEAVEALYRAVSAYNIDPSIPSEIGHFRWDDGCLEWRELLDDLQELNDNWAALGKKFTIV